MLKKKWLLSAICKILKVFVLMPHGIQKIQDSLDIRKEGDLNGELATYVSFLSSNYEEIHRYLAEDEITAKKKNPGVFSPSIIELNCGSC